ncbi:TonB-dependent receptor [Porticoccaceae bacterium]|nr:TonB-dependent receptor [Porticoccaceae bacterium]
MGNRAGKNKKAITTRTIFTALFHSFVKSFTEPLQGKARKRKISSRQPVGNISTEWKNVCAHCLFAAALTVTSVVASQIQAQAHNPTQQYNINIPAVNVAEALNQLADQTDKVMLFPYQDAKARQANSVVGRYTLMHALTILLKNSGLVGGFSENGAISISLRDDTHFKQGREESNDMNTNTKKTLLAAAIGLFAVGGAGFTVGQEDVATKQSQIDEVVVTAQRREQRLIDVPISLTAIGEETIKDTGIKTITDLSYHVSNFSVVDFVPGSTQYVIRGVNSQFGSSPLVGVYLDEMPLSPARFLSVSLQATDIKRVEVLKGPQGTLFGQGSVGGTIRYITNSPHLEDFEGSIGTSFSNTTGGDNSEEVNGVLNIPVITDTLAFRVAAKYSDQGGWIDHSIVGEENVKKDVNDSLLSDIRVTGLWRVSDQFDVKLMVNRNREALGAGNVTNGGKHSTSFFSPAVNDIDVSKTGLDNTFDLYNLEMSYDWGNVRLMSSTSKVDVESNRGVRVREFVFAAPLFGFDSLVDVRPLYLQEAKGFSQELRLVGQSETLNWTVGALYADVEDYDEIFSNTYAPSGGDPLFPFMQNTINSSKSEAVYGELSYDMSEKFTVSLGSRYFKDDRRFEDLVAATGSLENSFDQVSSSLKVSYAASDDSNIYFNISEGFRSGGFNNNGVTYKPENLINYTLGAKAAFLDGRINVDGAVFRSDYKDYQSLTVVTTSGAITGNPGEVEIEGLELSVQFNLVENLKVGLSGGVVNTELVKTDPLVTSVLPGDSLNFVPKYSYSAMLDYDFTWFSSVAGFFHMDYARTAKSTMMLRGGLFDGSAENADLGYLNVHFGAKTDNFTVRLFGSNLGNELRTTFPGLDVPNNNFQRRPRTFGFDINYDF